MQLPSGMDRTVLSDRCGRMCWRETPRLQPLLPQPGGELPLCLPARVPAPCGREDLPGPGPPHGSPPPHQPSRSRPPSGIGGGEGAEKQGGRAGRETPAGFGTIPATGSPWPGGHPHRPHQPARSLLAATGQDRLPQ